MMHFMNYKKCYDTEKLMLQKELMQIKHRRVDEGGATGTNAPALRKSCPLYLCPKTKTVKEATKCI